MTEDTTINWYNGTPLKGVYTAQDTTDLELKGNIDIFNGKALNLTFVPCFSTQRDDCARKEKFKSFIETHALMFASSYNYIDFEDIRPGVDPLKTTNSINFFGMLDLDQTKPHAFGITVNEHQASLQDNFINFLGMSNPTEINYLNFADKPRDIPIAMTPQTSGTSIMISLSQDFIIEKRIVYDIFMMFGDVGGLFDFLVLILMTLFGFWSELLMRDSLVQKLFVSEK